VRACEGLLDEAALERRRDFSSVTASGEVSVFALEIQLEGGMELARRIDLVGMIALDYRGALGL